MRSRPSKRCFNPRPLFAERATGHRIRRDHFQGVSIRARSLQSGRPAAAAAAADSEEVSIRARSLQSGRHSEGLTCSQHLVFQSAPALCRAGDLSSLRMSRAGSFRFNPRPLFAERATCEAAGWPASFFVSIRARSLQSGRRPCRCPPWPPRRSFNPRPLFAERATLISLSTAYSIQVSIRARSLQSGRPGGGFSIATPGGFQSAPALCRAGDVHRRRRSADGVGFNPRPLFAERATLGHHVVSRPGHCFNPRPLFAERATQGELIMWQAIKVSIRARSLQSGRHYRADESECPEIVSIRARSLQSGRLHFANLLMGSMKLASCREPWSVPVILHRRVRAWQPNTMRGKGCAYARTCRVCGGNRGSRIKPRVGHRNRWRGRCRIA